MTTPDPRLTDDVLRELLARRAVGPNSGAELMGDVLTTVDASAQAGAWTWHVGSQRRPLAVLVLALLLLSAAIGFGLFAGGVVPVPQTDAGDIAFVHVTYRPTTPQRLSRDGSQWDRTIATDPTIFTVASEGGEPAALAEVPGSIVAPNLSDVHSLVALGWNSKLNGPAVRWSPDGTRLAFRLFNDAPGIYLVERDGSHLTQLIELPLDAGAGMPFSAGFDWSPDGSQIAFVYPFGSLGGVYVVDVANASLTKIADFASRAVSWSPDGSRLAYVASGDLWIINADGTQSRILVEAVEAGRAVLTMAIAWSPDGSSIALAQVFQDRDPMPRALSVIDVDSSEIRTLGQWATYVCCYWVTQDDPLAWSPDGSLIATRGAGRDTDLIAVVRADGLGRAVVIEGSYFDWSPDGSRLVVSDAGGAHLSGNRFDSYSIYVINADGTGRRWLAEGEYPAWSPAGVGSD